MVKNSVLGFTNIAQIALKKPIQTQNCWFHFHFAFFCIVTGRNCLRLVSQLLIRKHWMKNVIVVFAVTFATQQKQKTKSHN